MTQNSGIIHSVSEISNPTLEGLSFQINQGRCRFRFGVLRILRAEAEACQAVSMSGKVAAPAFACNTTRLWQLQNTTKTQEIPDCNSFKTQQTIYCERFKTQHKHNKILNMKGSRITQTKQTPAYERFKTQHKHKIYQTDSFKTQETPGQSTTKTHQTPAY